SCDSLNYKQLTRKNFKPEIFIQNVDYIKKRFPLLKITISSTYVKGSEIEIGEVVKFTKKEN
ncbi:MAG: hypothetical protein LIP05_17185, partial [Tannerellaceae bacterium]|nr:hypothetical protein [Tannerellaceae bacterium]